MDRRALIKSLAIMALSACTSRLYSANKPRVVIAGAGIIGASIAYHLAKSGAIVTIIDKEGPASHASRGTFAWINATYAKQPQSYHKLNQESVALWHKLQTDLTIPVRWGGSLEWFSSATQQQRLATQINEQVQWGEAARMISAEEFTTLEPNIIFGNTKQAALSANDGAVDPIVATHILLNAAQALGATVKYPCELTGTIINEGRLRAVKTSHGLINTDQLVLATGAAKGVTQKFAGVEIPQRTTPGIIAITAPMPRMINHIIAAPGVHLHQRDDGRVVIGEQAGVPNNEAHAIRLKGQPNSYPSSIIAQQHAGRMLAIAKQFVPKLSNATIEHVYIGWRPLPIDGHPVLGPSPTQTDIYLAIMHSGVTLAPIVGKLVAQELLSGSVVKQLSPYRPNRQFQMIKRY